MHRLIWLNILAALGAFSAFSLLGCVILLTTHMDRIAATSEQDRLHTRAAADIRTSVASVETWARSDEAIRRLDHARDVRWAETTFPDIGSADVFTFTLDHDNHVISGSHSPKLSPRARQILEAVLTDRAPTLRSSSIRSGIQFSATTDFFWSNDTLYLLVAVPFSAVSPSVVLKHRSPPMLAAIAPYQGFVQSSMTGSGLHGMTVSSRDDGELLIHDAGGRVVGSVSLMPSHPGADLRGVILWPALALIGAFAALLVFAHVQSQRERRKLIASEARANYLAFHDQLTELANRRFLLDALNAAIRQVEEDGSTLALLMIDLDRFKSVNDLYGHNFGDGLICEMADRLRSVCDAEALCARLGGDEFVILVTKCEETAALRLASRIVELLSSPVQFDDVEIQSGGSVGVACFRRGDEPGALLRAADEALYQAKREGRNTFRLACWCGDALATGPRQMASA